MPAVAMHVCDMETPADVSGLDALFDSGAVRPADVVALVGKTEGTGLHDDYSRELARRCLSAALASRLGIPAMEAAARLVIVLSGGCFGVIAPHVTVITRRLVDVEVSDGPPRLVIGVAHSESIRPEEIGRMGQVEKVAAAVRTAMTEAGVNDARSIHCVMVKAPALTPVGIRDAESRCAEVVSRDLTSGYSGAISYSNDASALGVATALGELARPVTDGAIRHDWDLYSQVATTSAAGEISHAEVLLMANRPGLPGDLRVGHAIIRDPIDTAGVKAALRSAGLSFDCCPSAEDQSRVVQVFAKLIVPGSDRLRGHRLTLLDDHEAYRSAKAVGGALVASVVGNPAVFLSGGEMNSHQGPPGGSPIAAVVRA